jgi:hypothetical protein
MTDLIAKPIIENKYWVVESQGNKIAAVLAVEDGGYTYVSEDLRKNYPSIKLLKKEHNINFIEKESKKEKVTTEIFKAWDYPTSCKPYNILWNVKNHFAVFTKDKKSKSFYGAGHFLINDGSGWKYDFCPKVITLDRNKFIGPYFTKNAAQTHLREIRNESKS